MPGFAFDWILTTIRPSALLISPETGFNEKLFAKLRNPEINAATL